MSVTPSRSVFSPSISVSFGVIETVVSSPSRWMSRSTGSPSPSFTISRSAAASVTGIPFAERIASPSTRTPSAAESSTNECTVSVAPTS